MQRHVASTISMATKDSNSIRRGVVERLTMIHSTFSRVSLAEVVILEEVGSAEDRIWK